MSDDAIRGAAPDAPAGVGRHTRPASDAASFAGWLYRGARALSEAATPAQAVEAAAREARAAYRAAGVAVIAIDREPAGFRVLHAAGTPAELGQRYRGPRGGDADPIADTARIGAPVFIAESAELRALYPAAAAALEAAGLGSSASIPVIVDGTVVAVLTLLFRGQHGFTEHDHTFLMTMTEMLAQALRRTWLLESEQHARVDAEAANHAKTEFLAVMSHELRTPLNAVIGYAQILAHGIHGELNPEQLRDLERLQHSAHRLLVLLNHVIGFAQLERDHVVLDLRAVPVQELIAEVQPLVVAQVAARSQRLVVVPCDTRLIVRGDRDKLALVLLNLLVNATRYSPVGGPIRVSCERVGQRARIVVEDSGPGVPQDQTERIFEPFVQLNRGLTGKHEGTGLGLAVGRELARRMGGELDVENLPEGGARFAVSLPLWLSPELDRAIA